VARLQDPYEFATVLDRPGRSCLHMQCNKPGPTSFELIPCPVCSGDRSTSQPSRDLCLNSLREEASRGTHARYQFGSSFAFVRRCRIMSSAQHLVSSRGASEGRGEGLRAFSFAPTALLRSMRTRFWCTCTVLTNPKKRPSSHRRMICSVGRQQSALFDFRRVRQAERWSLHKTCAGYFSQGSLPPRISRGAICRYNYFWAATAYSDA
jgi:hypothetical protein